MHAALALGVLLAQTGAWSVAMDWDHATGDCPAAFEKLAPKSGDELVFMTAGGRRYPRSLGHSHPDNPVFLTSKGVDAGVVLEGRERSACGAATERWQLSGGAGELTLEMPVPPRCAQTCRERTHVQLSAAPVAVTSRADTWPGWTEPHTTPRPDGTFKVAQRTDLADRWTLLASIEGRWVPVVCFPHGADKEPCAVKRGDSARLSNGRTVRVRAVSSVALHGSEGMDVQAAAVDLGVPAPKDALAFALVPADAALRWSGARDAEPLTEGDRSAVERQVDWSDELAALTPLDVAQSEEQRWLVLQRGQPNGGHCSTSVWRAEGTGEFSLAGEVKGSLLVTSMKLVSVVKDATGSVALVAGSCRGSPYPFIAALRTDRGPLEADGQTWQICQP